MERAPERTLEQTARSGKPDRAIWSAERSLESWPISLQTTSTMLRQLCGSPELGYAEMAWPPCRHDEVAGAASPQAGADPAAGSRGGHRRALAAWRTLAALAAGRALAALAACRALSAGRALAVLAPCRPALVAPPLGHSAGVWAPPQGAKKARAQG